MSTDETQEAVSRPDMTDKRPWTEGELVCEALMGGVWIVRPKQNPNPKNPNAVIRSIGTFYHEADARLFAASPAMYEALEAAATALWETYGDDGRVFKKITAALRAANPDAFREGDND